MYLALLFLCAIISCGNCGSRSGNTYTAPKCGGKKFYCPETTECLPYSDRCTGDIGAATGNDLCKQKSYLECDYHYHTKKFEAYECSTPLQIGIKSKRSTVPGTMYELKHKFVTYRGLMYEFGRYGIRIQDPLDLKYEYLHGRRKSKCNFKEKLEGDCTFEEIQKFLHVASLKEYELFNNNCQDFTKSFKKYIAGNCKMPNSPNRQKRQEISDLEVARYIFTLGSKNCTKFTAALELPGEPDFTRQSTINSASEFTASVMLTIVVTTCTIIFYD